MSCYREIIIVLYLLLDFRQVGRSVLTAGEIGRKRVKSRKEYFGRQSQKWSSDDRCMTECVTVVV